jgi:very-short-patch-repair endonuclease
MRHGPACEAARAGKVPEIGTSAARTAYLLGECRISIASHASADAVIGAIAELQHARVSREQLLAAGVKKGAIARRLQNGRLERVHPGVYGLPHTADVPFADEAAALLACGAQAVLSHHSAAVLWRLRTGVARPVHVTIPTGRSGPRLKGVIVHRSRTLIPADIRIHQGLPVTSPARALLDVSPSLTDRDIERLIDEGLFALRILTRAQLADVLARAGAHPGRARLARVAGDRTRSTKTDSPPEEKLLALIRAAGLPEPELQVTILGHRLDFYWPKLRLAVEVDAYGTHGSRARFEADRRRDARLLTEKGIVVVRITELAIETRPFEVIALVARAVAQREAA